MNNLFTKNPTPEQDELALELLRREYRHTIRYYYEPRRRHWLSHNRRKVMLTIYGILALIIPAGVYLCRM